MPPTMQWPHAVVQITLPSRYPLAEPMRPHEPIARTKASGLARARMLFKAKLGWLGGHPHAGGWVVVPDDERPLERLALGREHLRRATYAVGKLRGEFPR